VTIVGSEPAELTIPGPAALLTLTDMSPQPQTAIAAATIMTSGLPALSADVGGGQRLSLWALSSYPVLACP
jgi:hypothetical protein